MPLTLSQLYFHLELVGRIILSALCGALIGIERKNRLKEAGIRTHLIVALGSALMMVVSQFGFFEVMQMGKEIGFDVRLDPSRVASTIITGIGFLGAGTIFVRKQVINGLTTAAGLWATAGIGMAIGAGLYFVGVIITLFLIVAQLFLHINLKFLSSPVTDIIIIKAIDSPDVLKKISDVFEDLKISIKTIKYNRLSDNILEVECFVRLPKKMTLVDAARELKKYDFIKTLEA